MSFKIIIEEIKVEKKIVKGDFTVIDQVQEKKMYLRVDNPGDSQVIMKSVYGYAPDVEKEIKTETKVFEQIVENLNLSEVIKAVNGL